MSQPFGKSGEDSESSHTLIRLLIADDQPRVRQSLKALFTALDWHTPNHTSVHFEIVGAADDGQAVVQQVGALHPDVVVLDLPTHDLPTYDSASQSASTSASISASASPTQSARPETELDGLTVIRLIKSQWPEIWVVVLTLYATDRAAVLLAGADVFLLKGCPTQELLEAVIPAG